MKNVLVGAVESTRVALEAMAAAGAPPVLLVTLPPERSSRHSDFIDLAPCAREHGVPVRYASDVNAPEVLGAIRSAAADYLFVIGWSQICGTALLDAPSRGAIGYHPAPLPEYRGRAVIPWTILRGRARTGSTLFWMDEGMDSGDVLAQECFDVAPDETALSLVRKHMKALERLFRESLPLLAGNDAPRRPQEHARATYCARRTAADGLIDWTAPAVEVERLVRAVGRPYPGAFTFHRSSRLTVWEASLAPGGERFVGLPGQIQAFDGERPLVLCGDGNLVALTCWESAAGDGAGPRRHDQLTAGGAA